MPSIGCIRLFPLADKATNANIAADIARAADNAINLPIDYTGHATYFNSVAYIRKMVIFQRNLIDSNLHA
jgi:hypothetical protein